MARCKGLLFLQVFDGYFVKYLASVVALVVYAAPIYLRDPTMRGSRDDITQDYIRAMRLLQNTSKCDHLHRPPPSQLKTIACSDLTAFHGAARINL